VGILARDLVSRFRPDGLHSVARNAPWLVEKNNSVFKLLICHNFCILASIRYVLYHVEAGFGNLPTGTWWMTLWRYRF
jgi:hypothetical protein